MSTELIAVPVEPTQEMLDAARDWALKRYGQGIGDDAARGCWKAMTEGADKQRVERIEWLTTEAAKIEVDRAETLLAVIEYVLQFPHGSGDALVWLREWCEGDPEAMAELTQWVADGKP